jgi:hypothetical protein
MKREFNIGAGWYRPEQWALLRASSVDRDELEQTHAEWLRMAENTLKTFRKQGQHLQKVDIDVEEMIVWAKAAGKPLDGDARSEFIAIKTKELNES